MKEIGIVGAFLGGILSLLSPCSALLLPSFFAYAFTKFTTLTRRSAVFLVGMLTVLVPLGAGVGAVGAAFTQYREQVNLSAAAVLIVVGLITMYGKGFGLSTAALTATRFNPASVLSTFVLGTVYGLAGFCSGPLLGAVLTVAVAGGSPIYGAALMAVYAAGMTLPLFLLALVWDRFDLSKRQWLRPKPVRFGPITTTTTSLVSGLLFVAIGVVFLLTEGTASLGSPVGADTMVRWQGNLRTITDHISNLWVVLALAIIAATILVTRIVHAYKNPNPRK